MHEQLGAWPLNIAIRSRRQKPSALSSLPTAGSKAAGKRSDIVFRKSKEKATRLRAGRSLKGFPASGLPANVEADCDTDS
jgi:hypothetical protein